MTTFRQIQESEWQTGDYRPGALIHRKSEELLQNYQFTFEEYWEDGLGKAKTAFFRTSSNRQFSIREIFDTNPPITEIFILNNPETVETDLAEVLEILNLSHSDLDFIYEWNAPF